MNNQTPREILGKFYTEHHLDPDGGQSKSSVKIEINQHFHFYFPNFDARRKAVIKHDIHHLLTGYDTSLTGESEISAWEIASGCKNYWAVFLIDTGGAMLGILTNLRGVFMAFCRGRRTKNLYHNQFTTEQALDMKISELQDHLHITMKTKKPKPQLTDYMTFLLFICFGFIYSVLSLSVIPLIILYSLYAEIRVRANAH